jgi:CheY-like chemotaxis protein
MEKILVIDDSEFDRRMIMSAISTVCEDLTCVELSCGDLAIETMKAEAPKLTIVDIRMPGIDGWGVLERIRADETLKSSKVIMMSGSSSEADIERATSSGAHGFYTKPHLRSGYASVAADIKKAYLDAAA